MMRSTIVLSLLLVAAMGCEKREETPAQETTPVANTQPASPATTAQQEQAAAEEVNDGLQLKQDFEEQAFEQVTLENAEQELDKLEKEIKEAEKVASTAGGTGATGAKTTGGSAPGSTKTATP